MRRFQETRHALGSEAQLTMVAQTEQQANKLFADLWQSITLFEATFSRFQSDSELTQVNQRAGSRTRVSPEFMNMLQAVATMTRRTNGLYNPFVLPNLQRAGYKGSWPKPEEYEPETDFTGRALVTTDLLHLSEDWLLIPAEAALDFGGIGKGYLLDQLADLLDEAGIVSYWLSLGGDIICRGVDADEKPWTIGISAAESAEVIAHIEALSTGRLAVATSGVTKRKGTQWHHLIDPRTGLPALTDILTATLTAEQAVEADVFAKCAVILGSQLAESFLIDQGITTSLLQCRTESETIALHNHGKVTIL